MSNKIVLDPFIYRQFSKTYNGTCLNHTTENTTAQLVNYWNNVLNYFYDNPDNITSKIENGPENMSFCKYLILTNVWSIKSGTCEITSEIEPYIKTGYEARNEKELPILTRWVELPEDFKRPNANKLVFIMYSKEQLQEESNNLEEFNSIYSDETRYGVIACLGVSGETVDPMPPITMMRNALGISEGGNGVELDKTLYQKSVDFWSKNILIKNK